MLHAMTSGAAGGGFISTAAGPLLLILAAIAVLAVPAVREALSTWVGSGREHLFGPAEESDTDTSPNRIGEGGTEADSGTGRASDRDSYDFDLDLLGEGD